MPMTRERASVLCLPVPFFVSRVRRKSATAFRSVSARDWIFFIIASRSCIREFSGIFGVDTFARFILKA